MGADLSVPLGMSAIGNWVHACDAASVAATAVIAVLLFAEAGLSFITSHGGHLSPLVSREPMEQFGRSPCQVTSHTSVPC
jgi:hypothetical protein